MKIRKIDIMNFHSINWSLRLEAFRFNSESDVATYVNNRGKTLCKQNLEFGHPPNPFTLKRFVNSVDKK